MNLSNVTLHLPNTCIGRGIFFLSAFMFELCMQMIFSPLWSSGLEDVTAFSINIRLSSFNLEWTTPLIFDTVTYGNTCKSEQEVILAISC